MSDPYAGVDMWGNELIMPPPLTDAEKRELRREQLREWRDEDEQDRRLDVIEQNRDGEDRW